MNKQTSGSFPSPLLAAKADLSLVSFPVLASPKIDGVRALVKDGVVYARSGKPIPNRHVQELFGQFHGYDGELVCGQATDPQLFRQTQSGVMAKAGTPDVTFYLFDDWRRGGVPYYEWLAGAVKAAEKGAIGRHVTLLRHYSLATLAALDTYESECLTQGFEGVMLRAPGGGYKNGRSTVKEGVLLKLKSFVDAEAVIVGLEEQLDLAGKPKGVLGALRVRDADSGIDFAIGTGFTGDERARFWRLGHKLLGVHARYRHFLVGAVSKPRFPVFAGLRSRIDMEASHV